MCQNASKYGIFNQKIRKIFWGGAQPPPHIFPPMCRVIPLPTPHLPRRLRHLTPPFLKSWVRHCLRVSCSFHFCLVIVSLPSANADAHDQCPPPATVSFGPLGFPPPLPLPVERLRQRELVGPHKATNTAFSNIYSS